MKKINLLFILFLPIVCLKAQTEIFSDALSPDIPAPLEIVGENLYVGVLSDEGAIYRIPLSNPNNPVLVTDFPGFGGAYKMEYDNTNNDIYFFSLHNGFLNRIDLDQNEPIDLEEIVPNPNGTITGIVKWNNILFLTIERTNNIGAIYKYNIDIGPSSLEEYFIETNNDGFHNPIVYNDNIYFIQRNNSFCTVYKMPVNSSNPQKSLVTSENVIEGFVQSSYLHQEFMYIGVEGGGNRILKLDLNSSNPITPETVINEFPGGPLGLAFSNGTFYASDAVNRNILSFNDPTLSLENEQVSNIDIYPNPVIEQLFIINRSTTSIETINLFDLSGRKISKMEYKINRFDLSHLKTGIYFLEIISEKGKTIKKFIKK